MFNNNSNTSQPLEMKDYIRYLGILIVSNLSWKFHIDYICQKVSRRSRSGKLNKLHVGFCFFSSSLTLPCCFRIVWHSFQPQTTQMKKNVHFYNLYCGTPVVCQLLLPEFYKCKWCCTAWQHKSQQMLACLLLTFCLA